MKPATKKKRSSKDRSIARSRYRVQKTVKTVKCDRCKTKKSLVRHHKDQNPKNNDPKNIQILCRRCHANVHREIRNLKCRVCGGKNHAGGLCHTHYNRFKKHGDPLKKCLNTRRGIVVKVKS